MRIKNYGHNVTFTPRHYYEPKTETEVLEILNRHNEGTIRVRSSMHAWNDGIVTNDVLLDLRHFNFVKIFSDKENPTATIGAGCKLENLIKILAAENLTVPTMGGIIKQTVAGLASTATHGSGNSSFSHFIDEVRIAAYDQNGQAKMYTFDSGDELKAARTAVGCLGVILSIKLRLVPRYWVEEKLYRTDDLAELIAQEKDWPFQAYALMPYSWTYSVFARRVTKRPGIRDVIKGKILRIIDYLTVEILPHLLIKIQLALPSADKNLISYYKNILPKLIMGTDIVYPDWQALTFHTQHHYTFRHVEMEVFIPERHIIESEKTIKELVDWFAGVKQELTNEFQRQLSEKQLLQEIQNFKGKYFHHYPLFFRKVFPDETLISMTAGNESYYAIGFFTFRPESKRQSYYNFTKLVAQVLNNLHDARLHWGKYFPLEHEQISRLYPELEQFKNLCRSVDPKGVFQNYFTKRVMGF